MQKVNPVLITEDDIKKTTEMLGNRYDDAKPIAGCRQMHSFESIPGDKKRIKVRIFSASEDYKIVNIYKWLFDFIYS